jgi:hypothetical protein
MLQFRTDASLQNMASDDVVKRIVFRRKMLGSTGAFSESGFDDWLVLLSNYQMLRYRGASFWEFLLSGETHIDSITSKQR